MLSDQAASRGIRARHQAMIPEGGEQGRAAVLHCFSTGATARRLCLRLLRKGAPYVHFPGLPAENHQ